MHLCNIWYKELTARFPATQDSQYYQFLGILSGWFLYITIFSRHHVFWCRNATTQNHLLKSATCLCYFHAWHLLMPPSTLRIKVRPIIMSYKASTRTGFSGPCQAYFQYLQSSYRDQTYPTSSASVFLLLFLCLESFCFLWLIFLISGSYFLKPSLAPRPNKADNTIFSFIVLIRVVISIYGNYIGFKFL